MTKTLMPLNVGIPVVIAILRAILFATSFGIAESLFEVFFLGGVFFPFLDVSV